MDENEIGSVVVNESIYVHRELGPGLLESVYEAILARQLTKQGLVVQRQVPVRIDFEGQRFEEGFRADMILNGKVMLELKSVETILNVHKKQMLTYLKLSGLKLGYVLNFGDALMKDGITRIINGQL
jgi:GxxExxY protein